MSDSPIFHFYSMDMSILCALISVLASLEIFVNFTLRCTYNKEKPRLFHRNRPDKIKGNHQYISAHGGFLVNLNHSLSPVLQEIRRERCIELAGEGFRFNDLKRWKAGKLLNNVLTYVGKRKPDGNLAIVYPNYTNPDLSYQAGKSRTWEDKMYLYPIPTGELQRNPQLLPQNPGW